MSGPLESTSGEEDSRIAGCPESISSIHPVVTTANEDDSNLTPASRTYFAPLPLIDEIRNTSTSQTNELAEGRSSSESYMSRETKNQAESMEMLDLGMRSAVNSAELFQYAQLQRMASPPRESSASRGHQNWQPIRHLLRANVLQKSKEKQDRKLKVRVSFIYCVIKLNLIF